MTNKSVSRSVKRIGLFAAAAILLAFAAAFLPALFGGAPVVGAAGEDYFFASVSSGSGSGREQSVMWNTAQTPNTFTLTVKNGSGGTVSVTKYEVDVGASSASVSGGTLSVSKPGEYLIKATTAVNVVELHLIVDRLAQNNFYISSPASYIYSSTPHTLTAAGQVVSSGSPTFRIVGGSGDGTIGGNIFTATRAGDVVIEATAPSDDYYFPVTVRQTLWVYRAEQPAVNLSMSKLSGNTMTGNPNSGYVFNLSGAGGNVNDVTLTIGGGAGNGANSYGIIAGTAAATISGDTLKVTGAGYLDLVATKGEGDLYNASSSGRVRLTVVKGSQSAISISNPESVKYGDNGNAHVLSVTGGNGTGDVTYTVTSGTAATVTGNLLKVTGIGNVTVQAVKAGDDSWNVGAPASKTFNIIKGDQADLVMTSPGTVAWGASYVMVVTGGTVGGTGSNGVSFSVTGGSLAGQLSFNGSSLQFGGVAQAGDLKIQATKAGNDFYNSKSQEFTLNIAYGTYGEIKMVSPTTVQKGQSYTASAVWAADGAQGNTIKYYIYTGSGTPESKELETPDPASWLASNTGTSSVASVNANTGVLTINAVGRIKLVAVGSGNPAAKAWVSNVIELEIRGSAQAALTVNPVKDQAGTDYPSSDTILGVVGSAGTTNKYTLSATGGSGDGAVTYHLVSGPGSISGSVLTVNGAGIIRLYARKAANGDYAEAVSADYFCVVGRGNRAAMTGGTATMKFNTTHTLSVTNGSSSTYFNIDGGTVTGDISGNQFRPIGTGTANIKATTPADANYNETTYVFSITVTRGDEEIYINSPPGITLSGDTVTISLDNVPSGNYSVSARGRYEATGSITYAISDKTSSLNGANIGSDGRITGINAIGSFKVTISKPETSLFLAASRVITVNVVHGAAAALRVILETGSPTTVFALNRQLVLATTGGSGSGAVTFTIRSGASVADISNSNNKGTLTLKNSGVIEVYATKAAADGYPMQTSELYVITVRGSSSQVHGVGSSYTATYDGGAKTVPLTIGYPNGVYATPLGSTSSYMTNGISIRYYDTLAARNADENASGGSANKTDAGTYYVRVFYTGGAGYENSWADAVFTIDRANVAKPGLKGGEGFIQDAGGGYYIYDGQPHSVELSATASGKYSTSDNSVFSATALGTYNVIVDLNPNYKWTGEGGGAAISSLALTWRITRRGVTIVAAPQQSKTYTGSALSIARPTASPMGAEDDYSSYLIVKYYTDVNVRDADVTGNGSSNTSGYVNAGVYYVRIFFFSSSAPGQNLDDSYADVTFTVIPAAGTINAADQGVSYNAAGQKINAPTVSSAVSISTYTVGVKYYNSASDRIAGASEFYSLTLNQSGTESANVGTLPINAKEYYIRITYTGSGNWAVPDKDITFTINKRVLTAIGLSKVYNADVAITVSGAALQSAFGNWVGSSQYSALTFVGAFSSAGVGAGKSLTTGALTGTGADNYALPSPLTGSITQAQLSITTVLSKEYDGTTTVTASVSVLSGWITPSDYSGVTFTAQYAQKNAGSSILINVSTFSGGGAANYKLPEPLTGSITQNRSALQLLTPVVKVYDGLTSAPLTSANISGWYGADAASATFESWNYNSKDAGTGKAVSGGLFNLSANYALPALNGSITPRSLTLAGANAITKVYDGVNTVSLSGSTVPNTYDVLSNWVGGEWSDISFSGVYDDKNAGDGKSVTGSLSGTNASNYTLPVLTGRITKFTLTQSTITKVYDGGVSVTTPASSAFTGWKLPEDYAGVTFTATYNDAEAGYGKTVTATVFSGGGAGNYALPSILTGTIERNMTALSLNSFNPITAVYNGGVSATLTAANFSGWLAGDASRVVFDTNWVYDGKNAGTGKAVSSGSFNLASNYGLPEVYGNITPKSLTLGTITKYYDGTTDVTSSLFVALSGWVGTDYLGLSHSLVYDNANAGEHKTVTGALIGVTEYEGNYALPAMYGEIIMVDPNTSLTITPLGTNQFTYGVNAYSYGVNVYPLYTTGGGGTGVVVFTVLSISTGGGELSKLDGQDLLTVTVSGTFVIRAYKPSDGNFTESYSMPLTLTIVKAQQSAVVLTGNSTIPYATAYNATASGGTAGAYSYYVRSGPAGTIVDSAGNMTSGGAGTIVLYAIRIGDVNYEPCTSNDLTVTVTKAYQSALAITSPAQHPFGTPYILSATGGSGSGEVEYAIESLTGQYSSLTGNVLNVTRVGTFKLLAWKLGDGNYEQGDVTENFILTVVKGPQTAVYFTSPSVAAYGAPYTASAAGGSGSGLLRFGVAAGNATIDASSGVLTAASREAITLTVYRLGDDNYLQSATVSFVLTVNKGLQNSIVLVSGLSGTFGVSYIVTAMGGNTGNFTYALVTGTSTGNAANSTLNPQTGVITFGGAGTLDIVITSLENESYAELIQIFTITVAKGAQTTAVIITSGGSATLGHYYEAAATGGSGTGGYRFYFVENGQKDLIEGGKFMPDGSKLSIAIQALRAGDADYLDAWSEIKILSVPKKSQSALWINSPLIHTYGSLYTVTVPASGQIGGGDGGGKVTYSIVMGGTGQGYINDNSDDTAALSVTVAGTIYLQAMREGDVEYQFITGGSQDNARYFILSVERANQTETVRVTSASGASYATVYTASAAGGNGAGAFVFNFYGVSDGGVLGDKLDSNATGAYPVRNMLRFAVVVEKAGDNNYNATVSLPFIVTPVKGTQASLVFLGGAAVFKAEYTARAVQNPFPDINAPSGNVEYYFVNGAGEAATSYNGHSVNPSTGVMTFGGAGNVKIRAIKAGNDYFYDVWCDVELAVGKAKQTENLLILDLNAVGNVVTYGEMNNTYTLSSNSGGSGTGEIFFDVISGDGRASVSGNLLQITRAGKLVIRAARAEDANYTALYGSNIIEVTVLKARQSALYIDDVNSANSVVFNSNGNVRPLSVRGGDGDGAVTYYIVTAAGDSDICDFGRIEGGNLIITGAGSIRLRASKAGSDNYLAVEGSNTLYLVIEKAGQAELFVNDIGVNGTVKYGDNGNAYALSASGGGGYGAVTFELGASNTGKANIKLENGVWVLYVTQAGYLNLRALKAGDSNYNVQASAYKQLLVSKGTQAPLSFIGTGFGDAGVVTDYCVYGEKYAAVLAGGNGDGAITFTVESGGVFGYFETNADAQAGILTARATGKLLLRATKAGDLNYNGPITADIEIAVIKANQTVEFSSATEINYGESYTASAFGRGGGSITYSVLSGPASIDASTGVLTLNTWTSWASFNGIVKLRAYKAEDSNFNAAMSAEFNVKVVLPYADKAEAMIALAQNKDPELYSMNSYYAMKNALDTLLYALDDYRDLPVNAEATTEKDRYELRDAVRLGTDRLEAAIKALGIDWNNLSDAVAGTEKITEEGWTSDSWQAFMNAKSNALKILAAVKNGLTDENGNFYSQRDINRAAEALNKAMDDLKEPGNTVVIIAAVTGFAALAGALGVLVTRIEKKRRRLKRKNLFAGFGSPNM